MKKLTDNNYFVRSKEFFGVLFLFFIIVLNTDYVFADEKFRNVFPAGEGRNIVANNCTVCHSSQIILQNNMTRERWDETISVMQEKHGLWYLGPEARNQILNYLSKVRGMKGKNSEKNKFKPFLFEYKPNPLQ